MYKEQKCSIRCEAVCYQQISHKIIREYQEKNIIKSFSNNMKNKKKDILSI